MARIVVYDAAEIDETQLRPFLDTHDLIFIEESLTAETADFEAEVISVFVSSKVDAELLGKFSKLKLIACRSTGTNNIDLVAAKSQGVMIANVPTYGEHTVAEYAFTLLTAVARSLPQAIHATEQGAELKEISGIDLYGKTLGVVGTGKIGRQVVGIGRGYGMKVLAHDIHQDPEQAKQFGYEETDLESLLKQSDVVSLHVPYTEQNHHLIDEAQLAMMKEGSILINTARGELVDNTALVRALQNGPLFGAGLDVLEGEQLLDRDEELVLLRSETLDQESLKHSLEISILKHLPNVVLTNHNAYNSREAVLRINQATAENIASYLKGEPKNLIS